MFETMSDPVFVILFIIGFIIITIVIYDLMTPDWSFFDLFEGLSNIVKILTL